MNNPLRWKQRFENFERALEVFQARAEECRENPKGSEYYEAFHMALIHSFEILIELSWKTLKDYLENEGYNDVQNGKRAIRRAFQDGIVQEGETWMEALENGTSPFTHTRKRYWKRLPSFSSMTSPPLSGISISA